MFDDLGKKDILTDLMELLLIECGIRPIGQCIDRCQSVNP